MNSDMLLNRIRMAQQGLIGVHKKLYTLEHLLPSPDPAQFAETAKSAALLSERSTASLRGFLFTTTGGMPEGYYQQAAAAQGIKVSATDDYVFIRVPALLPKKKAAEGFKFLVVPLQAAFEEYRRQHALPHFSDCVICIEHIYDRCLPITAVRDYDNLEFKSILDVIALYCMKDDTGALCDLYHTTRFSYASCTMIHQFIISPIEAHSKKPDEARAKIISLMGDLPRVELFARQTPPGWAVWGNEVTPTIPDFGTHCPEVQKGV